MQKEVNTQKSTNNPVSSFGLIEENIELSDIYLAVHLYYKVCVTYKNTSCLASARAKFIVVDDGGTVRQSAQSLYSVSMAKSS